MFFSRPCQHAIRAVVHLACEPKDVWCRVREIAKTEGLPAPSLAVILQNLARAGLVRSQKGPGGGFSLARAAADITLYQIVEAVDGTQSMTQCAIGSDACSDGMPCLVHSRLQGIRQQLIEQLQSITVTDMAAATAKKQASATT